MVISRGNLSVWRVWPIDHLFDPSRRTTGLPFGPWIILVAIREIEDGSPQYRRNHDGCPWCEPYRGGRILESSFMSMLQLQVRLDVLKGFRTGRLARLGLYGCAGS